MEAIIGKVTQIQGVFLAKDTTGNVVELKSGDVITKGMVVFGLKTNPSDAHIEIMMTNDNITVALNGTQKQLFDSSVVESTNDNEESIAKENAIAAIESGIYTQDDKSDEEDDNSDVPDETAAG